MQLKQIINANLSLQKEYNAVLLYKRDQQFNFNKPELKEICQPFVFVLQEVVHIHRIFEAAIYEKYEIGSQMENC